MPVLALWALYQDRATVIGLFRYQVATAIVASFACEGQLVSRLIDFTNRAGWSGPRPQCRKPRYDGQPGGYPPKTMSKHHILVSKVAFHGRRQYVALYAKFIKLDGVYIVQVG